MRSYIHYEIWDEELVETITFAMDKQFHLTFYWACNYSSILLSKLIHVCKSGPRYMFDYGDIGNPNAITYVYR